MALFPILYPSTTSGFPVDFTIAGKPTNEPLTDLISAKESDTTPTWGFGKFCFYCEIGDDHDSEEKKDTCKAKIECNFYKTAPGGEYSRFRTKKESMGHTAERCTRQYDHSIPAMPTWVTEKLNFEEQGALSRAKATGDEAVLTRLMSKLLGPGRVQDRQMEAEDARLVKEI
jgi:hypothetical protein